MNTLDSFDFRLTNQRPRHGDDWPTHRARSRRRRLRRLRRERELAAANGRKNR